MPQLLIRNLEEKTVTRLKELAKQHRRSFQGEVKLLLENHAFLPNEDPLAIVKRWQDFFAGRTFDESADLVREDRER